MFDDDIFPPSIKLLMGGLVLILILLILSLPITIYDNLYVKPIADNKANDYCKMLGFDQYKEFSRIGMLSKEPVAIKCEYAERYTDLGVRSNIQ